MKARIHLDFGPFMKLWAMAILACVLITMASTIAFASGDIVANFGADPTGVNDSTTAIQNALNSGGTITIPAGTFKVNSNGMFPNTVPLQITQNNTTIVGTGPGSSIIEVYADVDGIDAYAETGNNSLSNINISGVTFEYAYGEVYPANGQSPPGDWSIVSFNGLPPRCYNTNGINFTGVNGGLIQNCASTNFNQDGINICVCQNVTVSNCVVNDPRQGIVINGNYTGDPNDPYHTETGSQYYYTTGCSGTVITGCTTNETWDTGIIVGILGSNSTVNNCNVNNSYKPAIDVFNCTNTKVTNCTLYDWNNSTNYQSPAINVHPDEGVSDEPTSNITIEYNTCVWDLGPTASPPIPYGFEVDGNSNGVYLNSNTVIGGHHGLAMADFAAQNGFPACTPTNIHIGDGIGPNGPDGSGGNVFKYQWQNEVYLTTTNTDLAMQATIANNTFEPTSNTTDSWSVSSNCQVTATNNTFHMDGFGPGDFTNITQSGNTFTPSGCLAAGCTLPSGGVIYSWDNRSNLAMQTNGNLVLSSSAPGAWTGTIASGGSGAYLVMQVSGDLVLFNSGGGVVWSSYNSSDPYSLVGGGYYTANSTQNANLLLQNNGNLVIWPSQGPALWSTTPMGAVPSTPAGLTATAGDTQVSLSWTASSGATGYNVYRGTSSGDESATAIVTGITGTSDLDTGLTNGTAYYYKVVAFNSNGTSGMSNEASTTPIAGAPPAPTGLRASEGNTQVSLSWTASSGATSYNVYRGTSSGSESSTAIVTGITTTSYTNTSLTNGTAYFYKVAAVNSSGTSVKSTEASATPESGIANGTYTFTNHASGLNLNDAGNDGVGTALIQWTAQSNDTYVVTQSGAYYTIVCTINSLGVSVDGSTTAGSYILLETPTSGSDQLWTIAQQADGYYTVTNELSGMLMEDPGSSLSTGTRMDQAAATGGENQEWSLGGGSAVTPPAPTGLTATAGNTQVSLSWAASSGATSYNVYRGTSSGGESSTAIVTGLTNTSYTNTSLTNGTAYFYTVAAVNSSGTSGLSNEASATPTVAAPPDPTGLTATAGNTQVSLSWSASSGATSYNVYRGTSAGGESTTAIVTGITSTSYTNTGLTNGTTYFYTVAAVNSGGTSGISNEASATPTEGTPPAPTDLTATEANTQVSLSWSASSGATSYNVYRGTFTGGESSTAIMTGITGTSYTNTGLTNGTAYFYKVAAVNSSGTSGMSNEASATPVNGVVNGTYTFTNHASGLNLNDAGNDGVGTDLIQWTAQSDDTYVVTQSGAYYTIVCTINSLGVSVNGSTTAGSYILLETPTSGSDQLWTIAQQTDGYYTVTNKLSGMLMEDPGSSTSTGTKMDQATATGGENQEWSLAGGGTAVPPAPTGLTATAGDTQVSLSWAASSGATSYNVYSGTSAGGESSTAIVTGLTSTSYTNTGLTNGTTYFYKVAAVNSNGTSGMSNEASATPIPAVPPAPTGLTAAAGNAQVSLSWSASREATSYNVYRGTSAGDENSTAIVTGITGTSYTNTGLTNGTTYFYKVAAVNSSGTSGMSNEASATPVGGLANGTYAFTNHVSGLNLNDAGNDGVGTDLIQWTAQSDDTYVVTQSGAYYTIVCTINSLGVSVDGSTTAGSYILLETPTSGSDQLWTIAQQTDGYYTVTNKLSGMLMEDPGSSTSTGTKMDQATATGGENQEWSIAAP